MGPCPLTDPERFIDTNAMLFGRSAFPLLHHWVLMPHYGHLIGDRIMLHHLKQSGIKRRHLTRALSSAAAQKKALPANERINPGGRATKTGLRRLLQAMGA